MTKTIHSQAYKKLIAHLIEARQSKGLTQQELAKKLKRPQSYVAKVEGYERRLDVVEYLEMAKAIGAEPLPAIKDAFKKL